MSLNILVSAQSMLCKISARLISFSIADSPHTEHRNSGNLRAPSPIFTNFPISFPTPIQSSSPRSGGFHRTGSNRSVEQTIREETYSDHERSQQESYAPDFAADFIPAPSSSLRSSDETFDQAYPHRDYSSSPTDRAAMLPFSPSPVDSPPPAAFVNWQINPLVQSPAIRRVNSIEQEAVRNSPSPTNQRMKPPSSANSHDYSNNGSTIRERSTPSLIRDSSVLAYERNADDEEDDPFLVPPPSSPRGRRSNENSPRLQVPSSDRASPSHLTVNQGPKRASELSTYSQYSGDQSSTSSGNYSQLDRYYDSRRSELTSPAPGRSTLQSRASEDTDPFRESVASHSSEGTARKIADGPDNTNAAGLRVKRSHLIRPEKGNSAQSFGSGGTSILDFRAEFPSFAQ